MNSPTRVKRRYRVRRLEPRIALNATAKLSALGELLIGGDGADDSLDIGTNADGRIEITDANNAIVPIRIGTGPVLLDSVAPSQIFSGKLEVNLGGGNDTLNVELPENLNLSVIDGDGDDAVNVSIVGPNALADVELNLEAESISVDGNAKSLDLSFGSIQGVGPNGSVVIGNLLDVNLGPIQSTGIVDINADGNVTASTIETLGIDASVTINSVQDADLGRIQSTGIVDINADGNITASTIVALGTDASVTITSAQDADLGPIQSTGFVDINANGTVTTSTIETLGIDASVTINSVQDADLGRIQSTGIVDINADGNVTTSTIETLGIDASVTINSAQDANLGPIQSTGFVDINANGNITASTIVALGTDASVTITSAQDADLGPIQSTGFVDINANGTVTTSTIETLGIDASVTINSVQDADLGRIQSTGIVDINADGNVTTSTIETLGIDASVTINSAQDANLGPIQSTGFVDIIANGNITASTIVALGTDASVTITSAQDTDLGPIQSTGFVDINANGTVTTSTIETLGTDASVTINSAQDANLGPIKSTGFVDINAGGNLTTNMTETLGTDASVTINSGQDANLGPIQSFGFVDIDAVGTVTTTTIQGKTIEIIASGNMSDVLVGQFIVNDPATGDVKLTAGDDILTKAAMGPNIVANALLLEAGNALADGDDAIELTTQINMLDAIIGGTARGNLVIDEVDSVRLMAMDLAPLGDTTALRTNNGLIRLTAGGSISIEDLASVDDGPSLTLNQEIIAGGDEGRIELSTTGDFIAGDSVQLAAPGAQGTVNINANTVVLGKDFEINVQNGDGVARRFTPRPDPDGFQDAMLQPSGNPIINDPSNPDFVAIETAFYDVDSVSTDTLRQANDNDAIGTLSLNIGTEGERGLELAIDWGGAENRFTDATLHDAGPVSIEHLYTQNDIVKSRANGRGSATDPLAVRFSVSHHPSIKVIGSSVQQTVELDGIDSVSEMVEGELISSTDNPATLPAANPGLESGRAFFVIPRIDVPVAFFPARDVIPEPVDLPPPVFTSSVMLLSEIDLETDDSVSSSITIREEYFQLRTLSPDPDGEDLIEPVRLPDGVLGGDQLSELFAKLPDGAYEIQYIVGDTDQRTILRVELRGGEPIIVGDDLDGRALEIQWIEGEPESETDRAPYELPDKNKSSDVPQEEGGRTENPTADTTSMNDAINMPVASVAATLLTTKPFSKAGRFLGSLARTKPLTAPEKNQ